MKYETLKYLIYIRPKCATKNDDRSHVNIAAYYVVRTHSVSLSNKKLTCKKKSPFETAVMREGILSKASSKLIID